MLHQHNLLRSLYISELPQAPQGGTAFQRLAVVERASHAKVHDTVRHADPLGTEPVQQMFRLGVNVPHQLASGFEVAGNYKRRVVHDVPLVVDLNGIAGEACISAR